MFTIVYGHTQYGYVKKGHYSVKHGSQGTQNESCTSYLYMQITVKNRNEKLATAVGN